jgi:hypothetical protein
VYGVPRRHAGCEWWIQSECLKALPNADLLICHPH